MHGEKIGWRVAERLTDRLRLGRLDGSNRRKNTDIMALSGGRKEAVREYYVEKVHMLLLVSSAAVLLSSVLLGAAFFRNNSISEGEILRPGYGEGSAEEELVVKIDENKYEGVVALSIPQRIYTSEEVRRLLDQGEEEARAGLLGTNSSADEVRSTLVMPTALAGGAVRAEWTEMPYGILTEDGNPEEGIDREGTLVTLEGDLTLQGQHRVITQAVMVYPAIRSPEEETLQALAEEAERVNKGKEETPYYQLPEEMNGARLKWYYPRDSSLLLLAAVLLSMPLLLSALKDQRIRDAAQTRRIQLEMDYPDMVWKMTLLIGAGMNLSSAFTRVAKDYQSEKKQIGHKRYVYEEMLITCHEIRDGISEGKAYEAFGHRCGLPRYIRLGSILSQNLRKGSRGLTALLEQEAAAASRERQSQARKLGEKAGTKLLLPMVMMLCVVFVILVVPAFLSM